MRVLVTGGAGFIGANLVRALAADPLTTGLTVIDDLTTGDRANLDGAPVRFFEGSILDRDLLDAAIVDADAVVHLAARPSVPRSVKDPVATHEANATGTLMVLEAARRAGGPHLVVASSSSVYGNNPSLPKHEDLHTAPLSPYAVSKLATEAYALAYATCYDLDVLAFRFFNVFGRLQPANHAYAAVVPAFVSAALAGRPVTVYGDGSQTRDFTHVGSVCQVIADALHRRVRSDGPVNLAFGTRTSIRQLVDELGLVLGHEVQVAYDDPRPGDVPHSQADTSRLRSLFPDAVPVPLRDGLATTVEWFRSFTGSTVEPANPQRPSREARLG